MCMCLGVYMCTCVFSICGSQKRALDPFELELQAIVSCLMWLLGTEPVSAARAFSALDS